MKLFSVELWELVSFFEVEPEIPTDEAWPYTEALFVATRQSVQVSCAVAPAYKDVRIILIAGCERVYELNALGIHDVVYRREGTLELLDFYLTIEHRLTLRLKPSILLEQTFKAND